MLATFSSPARAWALLALATTLSLLAGCAKDDATASGPFVNFGPGEGIEYRSGSNLPVGQSDPTDWALDETWSATEQRLFAALPLALNAEPAGRAQRSRIGFGGYPNPTVNSLNFFYQAPVAVECLFVLVDKRFQVIMAGNTPAPASNTTFAINLTKYARIQPNQRYRIYYVLYTGSTLYYKGHGDFKVVSQ